ncbi:MAG: hypothetical protein M3P50_09775 [Actinomycetota bacterium]|nr:hypothetical protein [Actinomycetota bacterium]
MPISPSVSQISMPIRILLVGAVVLMAAWFTVLKPSDAVVPAAPATSAAPGGAASKAGSFRDTATAGAATARRARSRASPSAARSTSSSIAPLRASKPYCLMPSSRS